MSRHWKLIPALVALLLAAGLLSIGEARGRSTVTISCGQTVTATIVVDNNLSNCPADGLVVGASNITIDLNGHTIDGDDAGTDYGIKNIGGFDGVKILNGRVLDFASGIYITTGMEKNTIAGMRIDSNTGDGIDLLGGTKSTITGNVVTGNGGNGIWLGGSRHKVESNRIVANALSGIRLDAAFIAVSNNTITLNTLEGVLMIQHSNTVSGNLIARNAQEGVEIDSGSSFNTFSANRIIGNLAAGVLVTSASAEVFSKNIISGNDGPGIGVTAGGSSNIYKGNEFTGNDGDGLMVWVDASNVVVDGNRASGNGADGIDIDADDGTTLIRKNVADGNADRGIEAASGIDGGKNSAVGNNGSPQCQVVSCS